MLYPFFLSLSLSRSPTQAHKDTQMHSCTHAITHTRTHAHSHMHTCTLTYPIILKPPPHIPFLLQTSPPKPHYSNTHIHKHLFYTFSHTHTPSHLNLHTAYTFLQTHTSLIIHPHTHLHLHARTHVLFSHTHSLTPTCSKAHSIAQDLSSFTSGEAKNNRFLR